MLALDALSDWSLHTLSLRAPSCQQAIALLESLPSLEELEIIYTHQTLDPMFRRLRADSTFLPNLRVMAVKRYSFGVSVYALDRMISARRTGLGRLQSFHLFFEFENPELAELDAPLVAEIKDLLDPSNEEGFDVVIGMVQPLGDGELLLSQAIQRPEASRQVFFIIKIQDARATLDAAAAPVSAARSLIEALLSHYPEFQFAIGPTGPATPERALLEPSFRLLAQNAPHCSALYRRALDYSGTYGAAAALFVDELHVNVTHSALFGGQTTGRLSQIVPFFNVPPYDPPASPLVRNSSGSTGSETGSPPVTNSRVSAVAIRSRTPTPTPKLSDDRFAYPDARAASNPDYVPPTHRPVSPTHRPVSPTHRPLPPIAPAPRSSLA
ncbi:hypothetical protein B0H12DRAFT_1232175 [Mycena haematopus]|nr:hypothetical protein B0H12DRAFT_1232175 [Mycena haematopus]